MLWFLAPFPHHDIGRFILAYGSRFVWQVRHPVQEFLKLGFGLPKGLVLAADLIADLPHFGNRSFGRFSRFLLFSNFSRSLVAFGLEFFDFPDYLTALLVELENPVDVTLLVLVESPLPDPVRLLPNESDIQHKSLYTFGSPKLFVIRC